MTLKRWLLAVLLPATLLSCGGGTPQGGIISGTVGFAPTTTSAQLARSESNVVPGRVIVRFKAGVGAQGITALALGSTTLNRVRPLALERAALYQVSGLDAAGTERLAQQLATRPDVDYAEPDRAVRAFRDATDPRFSLQWNVQAPATVAGGANFTGAWDRTTGNADTVVAVLDTGILFRAGNSGASHPDLDPARMLPGYDFISNVNCTVGLACSNDGDGRDADPYDPGGDEDNGNGTFSSSYHGTFVAGIVGAATNNTVGVAGTNWNAKLLPVRILGRNGGTTSDILDALLWSAGVSTPGQPHNPNPADVINLSLGGSGSCSTSLQNAINQALAGPRKPVIVVAAGNEGVNAATTFPANCAGVITVGATDLSAKRTSYSNYGSLLSLMAPGGDPRQAYGGQSAGGGVLGLSKNDANGQFGYLFGAGTSFSAPQVAGAAALMRGVNPDLSADEVRDILKSTARPLSAGDCGRSSGSDCGAGLLDAAAALAEAPSPSPSFALSAAGTLTVAPGASATVDLFITRSGGFVGSVDLSATGGLAGATYGFSPDPAEGASSTLRVTVPAGAASGTYPITVRGVSGDLSKTVTVNLTVRTGSAASVADTYVFAFYIDANGDVNSDLSDYDILSANAASAAFQVSDLSPGQYEVIAWKDRNGDDRPDSDDYYGVYSANGTDVTLVRPPTSGLNVQLEASAGIAARAAALQRFDSAFRRMNVRQR